MVPHKSSRLSPFLMMHGRETIIPEEVNYIKFRKVEYYEAAVKSHIKNIIDIH